MTDKYGPIWQTKTLIGNIVFIEDCTMKERLMVQEDFLARTSADTLPGFITLGNDSLIFLQDEKHKQLRKVLRPLFQPSAVAKKFDCMIRGLEEAFKKYRIGEGEQVVRGYDVIKWFMAQSLQYILFGKDLDDNEIDLFMKQAWDLTLGTIAPLRINLPFTYYGKAQRSRKQVDARVDDMLKSECSNDGNSLLELMVNCQDCDGNKLTSQVIKDNIVLFMVASQPNTVNGISKTLQNLQRHPKVLKRLSEELDQVNLVEACAQNILQLQYLDAVVKETLRVNPLADAVSRKATKDIIIGDYIIPENTTIFPRNYLNFIYDERFVQMKGDMAPQKFCPDRWFTPEAARKGTFRPYGMGARMCIGMHYADLEMKVFVANFVKRYEFEMKDLEEKWTSALFNYPKDGLLMKIKPRVQQKFMRGYPSKTTTTARLRTLPLQGLKRGRVL